MSMLDVALDCIRRGWYVFPCYPRSKKPLGKVVPRGFHDATNDEERVRFWWTMHEDANVAIACGASGLAVLDIDHGINGDVEALMWIDKRAPSTYVVRTGRRPEMGLQLYFTGTMPDVGEWNLDGCSGQVKSAGGYVMAAGSIHPDSGLPYTVKNDVPLSSIPDWVRALKTERKPIEDDGEPITENRNVRLTSIAGKLRNAGLSREALEVALIQVNADRCAPPLDDSEVRRIAENASRWELPEEAGVVTIGGKTAKPVSNWREWFDTVDDIRNAPPVRHVIRGVVLLNRYNGIVALPGARKTIMCWNVVRSCLTREPLLGRFEVENPPERIIFLAAESARDEIKKRLTDLELMTFLDSGQLLIRSAAQGSEFHQDDLPESLVRGSLVIFDTFVRFYDGGDEQNALEARKFTEQMQRLVNLGATVLVMFHAPKGAKSDMLDLQSIRGSGELGAGLAHGFALSMQGPTWHDNTLMRQVKNREHQCDPPVFEFSCDLETAVCTFAGDIAIGSRQRKKSGPKKDAKTLADDAAAEEFIRANPKMPNREIARNLMERGIKRDESWVRRAKEKGRCGGAADPLEKR